MWIFFKSGLTDRMLFKEFLFLALEDIFFDRE